MKPLFAVLIFTCLPLSGAETLQQALDICRAEQNDLQRLACYDNIGITEQPQSGADPSSNTVTASATTAAVIEREANFGIEHTKVIEDAPDKLHMTVTAIDYSPRKKLIIKFSNGQVWRQNDTSAYKIAVGESHYIKRGVLNSFFLGNDQNNRTIRVKREK